MEIGFLTTYASKHELSLQAMRFIEMLAVVVRPTFFPSNPHTKHKQIN